MAHVDLRFCVHAGFGTGCIFAERATDSGPAVDVWFVDTGTTRTILAESLTEAPKVELPAAQRKALRSAHSEYRLAHRQRARRTAADKPRMKRAFRDRLFKAEWKHIDHGRDPAAVNEEIEAAE